MEETEISCWEEWAWFNGDSGGQGGKVSPTLLCLPSRIKGCDLFAKPPNFHGLKYILTLWRHVCQVLCQGGKSLADAVTNTSSPGRLLSVSCHPTSRCTRGRYWHSLSMVASIYAEWMIELAIIATWGPLVGFSVRFSQCLCDRDNRWSRWLSSPLYLMRWMGSRARHLRVLKSCIAASRFSRASVS